MRLLSVCTSLCVLLHKNEKPNFSLFDIFLSFSINPYPLHEFIRTKSSTFLCSTSSFLSQSIHTRQYPLHVDMADYKPTLCPSFSPQKPRSELQQRARSHSHSTGTNTQSSLRDELQGQDTTQHPKTASLDFEEFSYVDDQGGLRHIGKWLQALAQYLFEHYQATAVSECFPYLIVHCKDHVPPPSERPFMIAGLATIWEVQGTEKYLDVRFCCPPPSFLASPVLISPTGNHF